MAFDGHKDDALLCWTNVPGFSLMSPLLALSGHTNRAAKCPLSVQFAIVNWHKRPREETLILGEPRGPNTELRMAPEETIKSVEAGSLKFIKLVEIPPYHYGVIFKRAAL